MVAFSFEMKIPESFLSAENLYQGKLEVFFKSVFDESGLLSHGLAHHTRVWNFAREIISLDSFRYLADDKRFVEKLIIACLLNDKGM